MKEQLQKRLVELQKEFENGQKMLVEMESRQMSVKETMLRISGAIKVIEEELAIADGKDPNAVGKTAETAA